MKASVFRTTIPSQDNCPVMQGPLGLTLGHSANQASFMWTFGEKLKPYLTASKFCCFFSHMHTRTHRNTSNSLVACLSRIFTNSWFCAVYLLSPVAVRIDTHLFLFCWTTLSCRHNSAGCCSIYFFTRKVLEVYRHLIDIKSMLNWSSAMTQCAEALATRPRDLSSISRSHVGGENTSCSLTSPGMSSCAELGMEAAGHCTPSTSKVTQANPQSSLASWPA